MFILVRCPPCLPHGVTRRPPTKVEVVSAERELLCMFLWAKGRDSLMELLIDIMRSKLTDLFRQRSVSPGVLFRVTLG
jgi:hypothetical protein